MKAVILAGGLGTRISEESGVRPKPMVEIGSKPILWHIMKTFSAHGINEFIILCGYKSHVIKDFFANYSMYRSDVTFDVSNHSMEIHRNGAENWKVTLLETGEDTLTGGRIKRAKDYVGNESFLMTYGDGVSDVNITELIKFHKEHKGLASVTAVQPSGRFGIFNLKQGQKKVSAFREKDTADTGWVNGGYFVLEPAIFDFIEGDSTTWEQEPMKNLAAKGQLHAFRHEGFWHPMDTLRDKHVLEKLWNAGKAPWKVWKD